MPQLPESLAPKPRPTRPELEWQVISYKTVALVLVGIAAAAGVVVYLLFPEAVTRAFRRWFPERKVETVLIQQQARFLNLDGTVRVKKANAVLWTSATPSTTLEKGDVVQTGSDGLAQVKFADGTTYTVRADTLIVIEENAANQDNKSTSVAVKVSSGTVDLATTKFHGESKVAFQDAVANMRQDSRAMVKNNPDAKVHEILMTQGSSEVARGTERVELGQYEKVAFVPSSRPGGRTEMVKERAMGPPLLISPANLTPLMVPDPKTYVVNFAWTAVPTAEGYRVRIATNSIFSKLVYDKAVKSTSLKVTGLPEGTYFWAVSSTGVNDKESENSDASKFTIVKQQSEKDEILLVIDETMRQGRGFVIMGRTEPGARVMVNDEPVFNVAADGSFKHYTQPFAKPGVNNITVTAQNARGAMSTKRKQVFVEE